jgi:N4-gp56 family major capsid protein
MASIASVTSPVNGTGTSDIAITIQGHYDRNLLERALPELLYGKFGQTRPLPKNSGDRITFRRYASLPVNLTQLTEGVTPAGKALSASEIYAVMGQYGDYVMITDKLLDMGLDPVLIEAGDLLGEQAGLTIDTLHRNVLLAGTTVRYANGVANRAAVDKTVQISDVKKIVRTLEGNNAKKIREQVNAGVKITTSPLRAAFVAITHTNCRQDWENLAGFVPVEKYASQTDVLETEIGEIMGLRIATTTNAGLVADSGVLTGSTGLVSSGTKVDVYQTLVLAKNAFGLVPLQKGGIENIIKKAEKSGTSDALNQRNTSGWKAYTTAKILNDDFMARIEHGVTAL